MTSKTPRATVLFWILLVVAAAVGEPVTDALRAVLGLGITTMLTTTVLAVMMVVQLSVDRYVRWLHWLVVVLVSVFGTLVADNLIEIFGVAPRTVAVVFAFLLAATAAAWFLIRREAFYWLTLLLTFTLVTALQS
ncbi:putative membrane-anchored protein [Actinoplanes tereljensis]|uniref:Uncharacterized protein n=1 Tax=Paractinoplanes tereljensis TaxID=571912 RepID=A0A919NT02_9ACTN|nr:hypothetical protein [Actinoplanes tereljensis]GIF23471.1 hypothetical protein Ate02nite_62010 [Actinoplanes tereljensis]